MDGIEEVAGMSDEKILSLFRKFDHELEGDDHKKWEKLTFDLAMDRFYCQQLGVDYFNLTPPGFERVSVYALVTQKHLEL
jgi:hypothetical protein